MTTEETMLARFERLNWTCAVCHVPFNSDYERYCLPMGQYVHPKCRSRLLKEQGGVWPYKPLKEPT